MWVVGLIAGFVVAGLVTRFVLGRDRVAPMERHSRALEALRDLSEQPRPAIPSPAPPPEIPVDHVRILEAAPAGVRRTRRTASRRNSGRTRRDGRRPAHPRAPAAAVDARPTIEIRPTAALERRRSGAALAPGHRDPADDAPEVAAAASAATGAQTDAAGAGTDGRALEGDTGVTPIGAPTVAAGTTNGAAAHDSGRPVLSFDGFAAASGEAGVPLPPAPRRRAAARRARDRLGTVPPRVYGAVTGAAAVVAAITFVAVAGVNANGTDRAAGTPRAPLDVSTTRPVTAASVPPTTTPTIEFAQPAAPIVARSTNGATVSVPAPFRLTLHASGACWVQVTDAGGNVLFTGTLHAGQQQQLPVGGPIVVRLGYTPAISISVDGVTLDLSGLAQTANLDFRSV